MWYCSYTKTGRFLQVRYQDAITILYPIQAGIPRCSILDPILYQLNIADIPATQLTTLATYGDDTTRNIIDK